MAEEKDRTPLGVNAVSIGVDETMPHIGGTSPSGGSQPDRAGPFTYRAGDLVAERYKVVRALGEGGMGEVYEAEDLLLREHVALKTVREPVSDDETALLRF